MYNGMKNKVRRKKILSRKKPKRWGKRPLDLNLKVLKKIKIHNGMRSFCQKTYKKMACGLYFFF